MAGLDLQAWMDKRGTNSGFLKARAVHVSKSLKQRTFAGPENIDPLLKGRKAKYLRLRIL